MRRRSRATTSAAKNFVEKVWEWKEQSGSTITGQMRRLGASTDWAREYFTMDEKMSEGRAPKCSCALYEQGLIYRGKRLVNWDPVLRHRRVRPRSGVSEEEDGRMWHIRYPLADGSGHLTVATTRPETMLGDVAVDGRSDRRALHAPGRQDVTLPLADREIPIIADDYVDKEFGTGCVKITPAHDFNDYAVGQRHKLPQIEHPHARTRRSTTTRPRSTAAWTASSRASRSSPTSKRWACWNRSSRTS